jgi:hypothetical protein
VRIHRRKTTCCVIALSFYFQALTSCSCKPRMTLLVCVSSSIAGHPGEKARRQLMRQVVSPSGLVIKPDDWTGMDNSSAFCIRPTSTTGRNTCSSKFELQRRFTGCAGGSDACQTGNVRGGSVQFGVWAAYGSSPGLGPRAIEYGPCVGACLSVSGCKRPIARDRQNSEAANRSTAIGG